MSKNTRVLGASSALALSLTLTACGNGGEDAASDDNGDPQCGTLSIATLDDDSHRAHMYAIVNGHVSSDIIEEVEIDYMQIPALIQLTGQGEYHAITTSLPGFVNAREAGDIDLRVISLGGAHMGGGGAIYVAESSDIESGEELGGRTLGTTSLGGTTTMASQIVLEEAFGLDAAQEGGDIDWVELDGPTLLNALDQGDIDAALLQHQAGWMAAEDDSYRNVAQVDQIYTDITDGAHSVGSVFVSEGDWVDDNLECALELQDLIQASTDYAVENIEDFSDEIAEISNVPEEFVVYWWNPEHYAFGGTPTDENIEWLQTFLQQAYELGETPVVPEVAELVVAEE